MRKQILLFLLLVLPLMSFISVHKFYVSVTEIEYQPEQESVQIIIRMFIDDFEKVLNARYNTDLNLATSKENEQSGTVIERYILQKFRLKIDGENQDFSYLGKEYENDMALLYLEVINVPEFNEVQISNEIFFGLFPDQKNIVHIKVKDETKSMLLLKGKGTDTVNF